MKKKIKKLLLKLRESKFFKIFFSTFLIFGVLLSCVVVPSSAAEVDTLASNTNSLMYTAWYIPSGWSVSSGAFFSSTVAVKTDLSSSNMATRLYLGYTRSGSSFTPSSDSICIGSTIFTPSSSFYLYIFSDESDYVLSGWLDKYGYKIESGISDMFQITYQSIAPISSSDFSGSSLLVAFPGAHTLELSLNNVSSKNFLDQSDFLSYPDIIKYKEFEGSDVPYVSVLLTCNYPSVYLNNVVYSGSKSSNDVISTLYGCTSLEFYPVEHSYTSGVTYYYRFDIVLGNFLNSEDLYNKAYSDGFVKGYYDGFSDGESSFNSDSYNQGYEDGRIASDSSNLGQNLLGSTLEAPLKALNSFVIYQPPSGPPITLGLILGGCICLSIFIAFLKIFAGG